MRSTLLLCGAIALAATSTLGCNENSGADNGHGYEKPDAVAPLAAGYPDGPYGLTKGATIDDFQFTGFPNAKQSTASLVPIQMADFYNPHYGDDSYVPDDEASDDRLFPPGSPYGEGKPKPHALLIDIASVWCGPCNQEAKDLLPGLHAKYAPCGGEFLFQLIEGGSPGTDATEAQLKGWTQKYKVDYPATLDPLQRLNSLYAGGTFPAAAIVDTRTMTIVEAVSGVPSDGFWQKLEDVVGAECVAKQ